MSRLRKFVERIDSITEGYQKFLTAKDKKKLPKLKATENDKDPMVWVKFFNPYGAGTWFATEYDGDDTLFGYVMGLGGDELGYFSMGELKRNRVERDQYWKPRKLSQAKAGERNIHGYKEDSDNGGEENINEAVRAGEYFVIVDVSVAGGKLVDRRLYHGAVEADKKASKLREKGGNVQVIDAKWYAPAADLLKKLGMSEGVDLSEGKYELPAGFMSKKSKVTVKRVQKSYSGIGVEFLIHAKLYDEYLGDYLGSVQPEFFSDPLVKNGWSEEEINDLADRLKNVNAGTMLDLPKPIKMTVSVLKRKPFSWE